MANEQKRISYYIKNESNSDYYSLTFIYVNECRENWDGSNRNGSRSGLRGRGGRGMPINAGSSNKNEDSRMTTDINIDQNTEVKKDSETKRERKSRWGDNNETSDTIDEPITTQDAVSTSDNVQPANENELEVSTMKPFNCLTPVSSVTRYHLTLTVFCYA